MRKATGWSKHRFGMLTAIKDSGYRDEKSRNRIWECRCDCGKTVNVNTSDFRRAKSCGCQQHKTKHGHRRSTQPSSGAYRTWVAMIQRCTDEKSSTFKRYGERGIQVCDRWRHSFEAFLEDMGDRPQGLSLDRIDNDGNYCPENCRWATASEQNSNTRRAIVVTANGKSQPLCLWAQELGVSYAVLYARLRRGQDPLTGKRQ